MGCVCDSSKRIEGGDRGVVEFSVKFLIHVLLPSFIK